MSNKRRKYRTSLYRKRKGWHIDNEELDKLPNQPTSRELNGIRIGKRKRGVVIYKLRNKKDEELDLEIRHLLNTKQFVLKKGQHMESCDGYSYLQRWREKGIVSADGDVRDINIDLLFQGERIFI